MKMPLWGQRSEPAGYFRLLEQSHQVGLLGKKGVMPMGADHLPVVGSNARGANRSGKFAHRLGRKQPIRADAHKAQLGADAAESLLSRGAAAQRIQVSMVRKIAR